jgi:hypothetical protein
MHVNLIMRLCRAFWIASTFAFGLTFSSRAASSIDGTNRYAYGANIGWIDARADTTNGAVIGEYVCSGYLYSANVGWISLGNGAPTNGIQYQNLSGTDFGVNNDGLGNLRGYAYGANIGWVNFENIGAPKVDLLTGRFTGSIYSANAGWISLSNSVAYVQTDDIPDGTDSDHSGLADAWQYLYFGHLGVDPNADPDGDGMSNLEEYLAGTNPLNPNDSLSITSFSFTPGGTNINLTWMSKPSRLYFMQAGPGVEPLSAWFDKTPGVLGNVGTTSGFFTDTNAPAQFYRIRARRALAP